MIYQSEPFSSIFGLMTPPRGVKTFKILRWWFLRILQISLYYYLSSFYFPWFMEYKFGLFLTQFSVNDVNLAVKIVVFWESDLRNKLLTLNIHQTLISIFLSPSMHDIQIWTLFTQFGHNDVKKRNKYISQNFSKLN